MTKEIYSAPAAGVSSRLTLAVLRGGHPGETPRRYDFPPTVRFHDQGGTIWELHVSTRDPATWTVWVAPDGTDAQRVPLRLLGKDLYYVDPDIWPHLKYGEDSGESTAQLQNQGRQGGRLSQW